MTTFKTRHKLAIQGAALLLTVIATIPIYLGLQGGAEALAWAGLIAVALGMGLGLWVS